jgi:hypothetical protein
MTGLTAIGLFVITLVGLATTLALEVRIASLEEKIDRLEGRVATIDAGTGPVLSLRAIAGKGEQ